MKKFIVLSMLLISGVVLSQTIEPKYVIEGNLVKATYYHPNGKIMQEGFYKDGKVHGKWISYADNGEKVSLGEYNEGQKTGKWFFWTKTAMNEVEYIDGQAIITKKILKDNFAVRS